MQVITVDKTKDPELAALLADLQLGECIYGCFRLKSQDEQSAQLRLEEMAETAGELSAHDEGEDDDENEEAETDVDGDMDGEEPEPAKAAQSAGQRIGAMLQSGDGVPRQ